jgi:Tfp pilus assembly protein FimT
MKNIPQFAGISLIELLTTLVIVSSLTAMAVPLYSDLTSKK